MAEKIAIVGTGMNRNKRIWSPEELKKLAEQGNQLHAQMVSLAVKFDGEILRPDALEGKL